MCSLAEASLVTLGSILRSSLSALGCILGTLEASLGVICFGTLGLLAEGVSCGAGVESGRMW